MPESFATEVWGAPQAKAAIETMTNNRPVNQTRVRAYVRAMIEGRWTLSPHAIVFDTAGRMIDGQHRAYAVLAVAGIRPGFTVQFTVARGCDPEVAKVLDTGLPKGANAIGTMLRTGMNRAHVACATGMLNHPSQRKMRHKWMPDEIVLWYEQHKAAIDFAADNITSQTMPVVGGILRVVVARAWYSVSRTRLEEFGSVCRSQYCESEADTAAHVLKSQAQNMQAKRMSANTYGMRDAYSLCDNAVWAFCRLEPTKLVRPTRVMHFVTPHHPQSEPEVEA